MCSHHQHKLNKRHAKWVEFLESFPYVIRYKKGKENVVADSLSRRYVLLNYLDSYLIGFSYIRDLYATDPDFGERFSSCEKGADAKFYRHDGYLFKDGRICIPQGSMREVLIREAHEGGLMGHFGVTKTLHVLKEHLFWPKMRRDVERHCERCVTCKKAKSKVQPHDLLPLPQEQVISKDGKARADYVKRLHQQVKENLERRTQQYERRENKGQKRVTFEVGDWVWVHFRKERFPAQRSSKLLPRGDGPFQVVAKVNENAYKLDLPGEYNVSATFNVSDLTPFDDPSNLRTNPFQEGGDDVSTSSSAHVADPEILPQRPVTRSKAKQFREALSLTCAKLLDSFDNICALDNRLYNVLQADM
ncbi:hypothetical protein GQ457_03G017080 [Hibiscus cannabinus]